MMGGVPRGMRRWKLLLAGACCSEGYRHLARAEGAPTCVGRDGAEALGALLRAFVRRRVLLQPGHEHVHRLDHEEEYDRRNRHERDQLVDEVAVEEGAAINR